MPESLTNRLPNGPVLFLMYGYPGSGKSTFARQLAPAIKAVRLNSDELRAKLYQDPAVMHTRSASTKVFAALDYTARQILQSGISVVYDANLNQLHKRQRTTNAAAPEGATIVVIWINTPLDMSQARELRRAADGETREIPPDIYQAMVSGMEPPAASENCIEIDGQVPFETQLEQFNEQYRTF